MNFEFTPDQTALLDAVARVVARQARTPATPTRLQYSPQLRDDLAQGGFFECMQIEELGAVAAAAMVIAVASSPLCAEVAGSALVAPLLGDAIEGPVAVVRRGREAAPTRYLPMAKTLIRIGDDHVDVARLAETKAPVAAIDSIFAYPMGTLIDPQALVWHATASTPARAMASWRIGIAAEIVGNLDAALQSVLAHVRERRQFGSPLGSFQAIQHRLAECAMRIEGSRWLVLKAASTGREIDGLVAIGQAQRIATRVCYDLHQFMGAMGLTLEHPLHRWTYRAKLLRSELGGADRQFIAVAHEAWGSQALKADPINMETST